MHLAKTNNGLPPKARVTHGGFDGVIKRLTSLIFDSGGPVSGERDFEQIGASRW